MALPLAYSAGSDRIHGGLAPTLVEKALDFCVTVLYFPLVHIALQAPRHYFPGLFGYVPMFLNSAFCAVVLVLLYVWLCPKLE